MLFLFTSTKVLFFPHFISASSISFLFVVSLMHLIYFFELNTNDQFENSRYLLVHLQFLNRFQSTQNLRVPQLCSDIRFHKFQENIYYIIFSAQATKLNHLNLINQFINQSNIYQLFELACLQLCKLFNLLFSPVAKFGNILNFQNIRICKADQY